MNLDSILNFCTSLNGTTNDFPFDQNTLVFRIKNKIFALINVENANSINLKCDPEKAIELRECHTSIIPGFHMNKKHWNTVYLNQDLDDAMIRDLIQHSYEIVVKSLPKKLQDEL